MFSCGRSLQAAAWRPLRFNVRFCREAGPRSRPGLLVASPFV